MNFFTTPSSKNIIATLRIVTTEISELTFLLILYFHVAPHLGYGDVIYDQTSNSTLSGKIESVQYNSALGITSAIRGTSREKLCQELGLECLKDRKCLEDCYFHKVLSTKLPSLS